MVGLGRLELPTSRLSSVRSNQLSYRPFFTMSYHYEKSGHGRIRTHDLQFRKLPLYPTELRDLMAYKNQGFLGSNYVKKWAYLLIVALFWEKVKKSFFLEFLKKNSDSPINYVNKMVFCLTSGSEWSYFSLKFFLREVSLYFNKYQEGFRNANGRSKNTNSSHGL